MVTPFFSVCIPVFNGQHYLDHCLQSIFAQTFQDFEVILVDDCSTDNSVSLIQAYQKKEKRLHLFLNDRNQGLVKNWNLCIEKSTGQWIKFLFQDDHWQPSCLEIVYAHAHRAPFIFHARNFVFGNHVQHELQLFYTSEFVTNLPELRNKNQFTGEEIATLVCKYQLGNFFGEPSNIAFRKDMIDNFGVFNEHLIQLCDYEYWCRIASNTGAYYIEQHLSTFYVHGQSTTTANMLSKQFRFKYLDDLIILKEFSASNYYISLRRAVSVMKPLFFEKLYKNQVKKIVYFLVAQPVHYQLELFKEIDTHAPYLNRFTNRLFSIYVGYRIGGLLKKVTAWLRFQ